MLHRARGSPITQRTHLTMSSLRAYSSYHFTIARISHDILITPKSFLIRTQPTAERLRSKEQQPSRPQLHQFTLQTMPLRIRHSAAMNFPISTMPRLTRPRGVRIGLRMPPWSLQQPDLVLSCRMHKCELTNCATHPAQHPIHALL
jgi:hypothetical protein